MPDVFDMQNTIQSITAHCLQSPHKDPVRILLELMQTPAVRIHGPEHHILVGACLLTACKNAGAQADLSASLAEMAKRGAAYPGAACGMWGVCGAAASCGMAVSILTGAGPLSAESWRHANAVSARALSAIAPLGGPRCCKRDSFTALLQAGAYIRQEMGIPLQLPERIFCGFSGQNAQCIGTACPYHVK